MNIRTKLSSIALVVSLVPAVMAAGADAAKPAKPPTPAVGEEVLLTVAASIQSINHETRELTLKGPLGNVYAVTASPEIKRLNEFKVGDDLVLDYYVAVAAEVRPPTEAEKKEPFLVLEDAQRAGVNSGPAGGAYRIVRAVVTVEGIDLPTQTATVKGPRGNSVTIKVQSPDVLKDLKLGASATIVYTEAVAVRLEKAAPKPAKK
jgi:hypothetical protein